MNNQKKSYRRQTLTESLGPKEEGIHLPWEKPFGRTVALWASEDWSGYSWWGRGASILRTVRFYLGNTDAGELWTCGGTER